MTEQTLRCASCQKHMATLRDAKVRIGMVVYCRECDPRHKRAGNNSMPPFMREFFWGLKS